MIVKVDLAAMRRGHWYEYALRFLLGGLITVITGLVAKGFGPAIGGLFLAFPAILPASATLVDKHEREKKERRGLNGTRRGRAAAALDAYGAALGSVGLLIFAVIVWTLLPTHSPALILMVATIVWGCTGGLLWWLRH